jgi:3-hydroxybutyryl-CoA dehydrogenase
LFNQLNEVNYSEVIFTTSTYSLSVSAIAKAVINPQRVAGMRFDNAPEMQLVEVTQGNQTSDETIESIMALAKQMGKTPVLCKDTPCRPGGET